MKLIKDIFKESKKYETCELFTGHEDYVGIVHLLMSQQGIEYCTKNNFPEMIYFRRFDQTFLQEQGIYVDAGLIEIKNKKKVFIIGDTDAVLKYDQLEHSFHVVLMHGATAKIIAEKYAVVFTYGEVEGLKIEKTENAIVQ